MKVLEEERTAKNISNKSSETQIVLGWLNSIAERPNPVFEKYKGVLPELFGVSQVEIADAVITEGEIAKGTFYVQAKPAEGSKCERCWRFTTDVGNEAKYPTVCLRCAEALASIGFASYRATVDVPVESRA